MVKKLVVVLMLAMLLPQFVMAAAMTPEMTVTDKAAYAEKLLYGSEQTGSLVERIGRLEKDVYGRETRDSLIGKIDRIYSHLKENTQLEPSFTAKLNAVEWALTHNITLQPAKNRIESLELMLYSNSRADSYDVRLTRLMSAAFSGGQADLVLSKVTKDTLIKIKMVTALSSKDSRVGDAVVFEASEDVFADNQLVIAKGAKGVGKIAKVEQAKNFGRDAQLQVSFESMEAIDGTTVEVLLGDKAKEETKSMAKAAGASVAGMAILGPIGIIGGAFIHGRDVTINPGSELFVQTKNDIEVYGVKTR